jgi:hypothetical protein
MKIDQDALIQNLVMVVAFVAAVDGCALYSLKTSAIRPVALRLLWAAIILLLPAVGALAFFFLRPADGSGCLGCCRSEQEAVGDEASPVSAGSSSCQSASPASVSGEATTPNIMQQLHIGKSPAGASRNEKWMYAPSS